VSTLTQACGQVAITTFIYRKINGRNVLVYSPVLDACFLCCHISEIWGQYDFNVIERSLLKEGCMHLFKQKYIKIRNIEKYYYNLE